MTKSKQTAQPSATLTTSEASREGSVFSTTIYALLNSGKLRAERIEGKWHIERESFEL